MKEWFRFLPHFGYGKCGGRNRDCSMSKPRDWMDKAFENHDCVLHEAEKEKDKKLRNILRRQADVSLGKALRSGNAKELKLYSKIYLFFAKLIFR